MFETLRDYPLPHHNSLLKLTEKGTTDARDGLWPTFDASIALDWNVLTRDTNGTKIARVCPKSGLNTRLRHFAGPSGVRQDNSHHRTNRPIHPTKQESVAVWFYASLY